MLGRPGGRQAHTTVRVEIELAPATRTALFELVTLAHQINNRLNRMEHNMTDLDDLLNQEQTTLTDVRRVLANVASDVAALLNRATGVFTPEERAKADATLATLSALGDAVNNLSTQVGDQDGDGNPAPPPPPPPPPAPGEGE